MWLDARAIRLNYIAFFTAHQWRLSVLRIAKISLWLYRYRHTALITKTLSHRNLNLNLYKDKISLSQKRLTAAWISNSVQLTFIMLHFSKRDFFSSLLYFLFMIVIIFLSVFKFNLPTFSSLSGNTRAPLIKLYRRSWGDVILAPNSNHGKQNGEYMDHPLISQTSGP